MNDPLRARAIRKVLLELRDTVIRVEWVRSYAQAEKHLGTSSVQVFDGITTILTDLLLPDGHGTETIDRLSKIAPHVPILVLTSAEQEGLAREAIEHGAHDYLLLDHLDGDELAKSLRRLTGRAASTDALLQAEQRAQLMLNAIGDAVISADVRGNVTYLNSVAEMMTGWSCLEATGHPVTEVMRIVDATTRAVMPNPLITASKPNKTVVLADNCALLRRDGVETAIEDSTAPIHDHNGRCTGAIMVFHDVSAKRAHTQKLARLTEHDALTGLPNIALLGDRLSQAIALTERHGNQLAVLFIDIDRFKSVNDSLGHLCGDRLLQSVAQRLLSCVRSTDTVCRRSGDEFVVLLSEIMHAEDASICAKKIIAALAEPHCIGNRNITITASIGIAICPEDGVSSKALLSNADSAMYCAKDSGRSNYQFFQPDLNGTYLKAVIPAKAVMQ